MLLRAIRALEHQAGLWRFEASYYNDAPGLRRTRLCRADAIVSIVRELELAAAIHASGSGEEGDTDG